MDAVSSKTEADSIPLLPEDVPVTMPNLPARRVVNTFQQFKAVSDPTRSRILSIIQNQPATAKQIADRLGATPGAIGHHMRVLEEAGLAQVVARRLVRGIVASYYTRTAKIFMYELPEEMRGNEAAGLQIMSKAYDEMDEARVTIKDDPYKRDGFPHARLSPERARYYYERIEELVEEILNEPSDVEGEIYGIFVAMFKSPPYMQGPATALPPGSESTAENP
jgi:DNA-binding transcriptional ArsR family regulator